MHSTRIQDRAKLMKSKHFHIQNGMTEVTRTGVVNRKGANLPTHRNCLAIKVKVQRKCRTRILVRNEELKNKNVRSIDYTAAVSLTCHENNNIHEIGVVKWFTGANLLLSKKESSIIKRTCLICK